MSHCRSEPIVRHRYAETADVGSAESGPPFRRVWNVGWRCVVYVPGKMTIVSQRDNAQLLQIT